MRNGVWMCEAVCVYVKGEGSLCEVGREGIVVQGFTRVCETRVSHLKSTHTNTSLKTKTSASLVYFYPFLRLYCGYEYQLSSLT